MKRRLRALAPVLLLALVLAACGDSDADPPASDGEPASEGSPSDDADGEEEDAPDEEEPSPDGGPLTAADRGFDPADWDAIVEAARGTTVNFHMWGGSEGINGYMDGELGAFVAEHYDITLNRVPLADTVDGVNTVLNEIQAGRVEDGGSVDLIWINGENYFTMNQAAALLTGWERQLPNAELVDWESPEINMDFGNPVEGQSPWGSTSMQMIYDSARMSEDELPRNFAELREWILANPGRFTYPQLPAFQGTRFIQGVLYETTGGHENWEDFDPDTLVEDSRAAWEYLQEIDSALWQGGQSYANDMAHHYQLFANGEIDLTWTLRSPGIESNVLNGELPESARPFVLNNYAVSDSHFIGLPVNASNVAGALVVANAALHPEMQLKKFDPSYGWGDGLVIQVDRLDDEFSALFEDISANLEPYGLPVQLLQENAVPNVSPALTRAIDETWDTHIRQGQPLP